MPKRVIDGEALWKSHKLKSVPAAYRAHYANWLPMANHRGVFEAEPDTIWATIYAFLMPEISESDVVSILAEFTKAGLLQLWEQDGRKWGYFVGIEKAGRLPPKGHYGRYSDSFPEPPQDISGSTPANIPHGVGVGVGVGIGKTLMSNQFDLSLSENGKLQPADKFVLSITLKSVWDYYLQQTGKNGALYTLTPARKKMGLKRLTESAKKVNGDLDKAGTLMRCAIDAMVSSDFHQGKNDSKKKYLDWDILFRSADKLEKWLERSNEQ